MDTLMGLAGAAVVMLLGLAGFIAGTRIGKRLGKVPGEAVAGVALLITAGLVALVSMRVTWIPREVFLSPLIYAEYAYYVPTGALFLGIAAQRLDTDEKRRALRGLTALVAVNAALHVFLAFDARDMPELNEYTPPGPVCQQTTAWSCGAASCVTLFKAHGVDTTEREMGELCLTYPKRGTTLPRFYRGLTAKIEKEGLDLEVNMQEGLSMDDLDAFPKPCLISLRFTAFVSHATVVMRREGDRYFMADPLDGNVTPWTRDDVEDRFQGDAIALVKR